MAKDENELVREYAAIANDIYNNRTVGDYTWLGVFASFANELKAITNNEPEVPEGLDARVYAAGYRDAEIDIKEKGFKWAESIINAYADDMTSYAVGYRTAVGVYRERQLNG
jgi:hypothetical protein